MISENKKLKGAARRMMMGHYRLPVFSVLLGFLLSSIIYNIFVNTNRTMSDLALTLNIIALIAISLISSLMRAGRFRMYLNIERRRVFGFESIWHAFTNKTGAYLSAAFMYIAIELSCMIPGSVFLVLWRYEMTPNPTMMLILCIVLYIMGAIMTIILLLPLSFVYIVLSDIRMSTFRDALRASRNLSKGRMKKLFLLYVSFIGVYFLSVLSFGLGFLWTMPYVGASLVTLYVRVLDE